MSEIRKYGKNVNFSNKEDENINPFNENQARKPIIIPVKPYYQLGEGLKM